MERFVFILINASLPDINIFATVQRSVSRNDWFHAIPFLVMMLTPQYFVIKKARRKPVSQIHSQNEQILDTPFVESRQTFMTSQHQRIAEKRAGFCRNSLFFRSDPSTPLSNSPAYDTTFWTLEKHRLESKPLHYGMGHTSSCPVLMECVVDRAPALKLFRQL